MSPAFFAPSRLGAAVLTLAGLAACAAPLDAPTRPFAAPPGVAAPRGAWDGPDPGGRGPAPVLAAYPRRSDAPPFAVGEATGTGAEGAFAAAVLADLQLRSFAENRELCGYLGLDGAGRLATTAVAAGSEASCPLPPIPADLTLLASFHTHSTYSPFYASEWPTSQDVLTDAATGIDGYISTPGGRLWHVDTDTMTVREVCGRGCLPQDPAYVAAEDGPLRPVMTLRDLLAWERGPAR